MNNSCLLPLRRPRVDDAVTGQRHTAEPADRTVREEAHQAQADQADGDPVRPEEQPGIPDQETDTLIGRDHLGANDRHVRHSHRQPNPGGIRTSTGNMNGFHRNGAAKIGTDT